MSEFEKGKSGNQKTRFSKDRQPGTRNGGRKKKIGKVLKEAGYGREDIVYCMENLLFKSEEELVEIKDKADSPIILKILANGMRRAAASGDMRFVKDVFEYLLVKTEVHKVEIGKAQVIKFGDKEIRFE